MTYSCFDTPQERTILQAKYPTLLSDATDVALGDIWAYSGVIANACGERLKDLGGLVGTAFAVRDMMQVVDALDEDGLLRFWGEAFP